MQKNTKYLSAIAVAVCVGVGGVLFVRSTTAKSTDEPTSALSSGSLVMMTKEEQAIDDARYAETRKWEREAEKLRQANQLEEAERACLRSYATLPEERRTSPGTVAFVLGDIYLAQGRYKEATEQYLVGKKNGDRSGGNGDINTLVALCYIRLGDLQMARQYASPILSHSGRLKPQDLPGTGDTRSLEASILMSLASDASMHGEDDSAFRYIKQALVLAPDNGWLQYQTGRALYDLKRYEEAQPYFRKAVQTARGEFAKDAKEKIEGWQAWQRQQRDGSPVQQTVSAAELQAQRDSFERGANGWKKDYEDSLKRMTPAQRQAQEDSMKRLVEEQKLKQQ